MNDIVQFPFYAQLLVAAALGGVCACGDAAANDDVALCYDTNVSVSLCDPATASFTLASTNQYYPLIPGLRVVLEGIDHETGDTERVVRTVLAETRTVAGVEVHVLRHETYTNGELEELATNFYVEATDGTVCYFGEDVEWYEGGQQVDTAGSWRAGVDGAAPGVIMPAAPSADNRYLQENAPGIALDMGRVDLINGTMTVNGVVYEDVVTIYDINPFEGCVEPEQKRYIAGIGEVQDVDAVLVEFELPSGS
ncbi:MAG: hypothetical protein H6700_08420 [Myxococcales bacterium]|nr:hypothetical protein [Myxococcales bacterium]